jgi:polyisoprenoid-binding protein YceI
MTNLGFPRRTIVTLTLALATLSVASSVVAQDAVLQLDPAQTQVSFTLGAVLHTVHGTFKLKRGTVKFDPVSGHASGLVVIDATSGNSDSSGRDHKMHKDILESAQYPEVTFAPQQVQGQVLPQGDFKVQVLGSFMLHGVSHPLTLVIQVHLTGDRLTADTEFPVPYQNWGLKNPSTLFLRVDDTVNLSIHAVGQIKMPSAH